MNSRLGLRLEGTQDLVLVMGLAVAAVVSVALNLPAAVRVLFAIPLVLIIPGYGLIGALFPARVLPTTGRLALSIAASMVLAIATGLGLAAASIRLESLAWTVALAGTALTASAVAWFRRNRGGSTAHSIALPTIRRSDLTMLSAALLTVVVVLAGTRAIAAVYEAPSPAQLWMLAVDEGATEARLGVRADDPGGDYRVRVTSAGVLLNEFSLILDGGEVWETVVTFTSENRQRPVVARLYRGLQEVEIRFVVLQPLPDSN